MDKTWNTRWRRLTRILVYGLASGAASGAGAIAVHALVTWAGSRLSLFEIRRPVTQLARTAWPCAAQFAQLAI